MPFGVANMHDMPATNMFLLQVFLQGVSSSFLCGMNEETYGNSVLSCIHISNEGILLCLLGPAVTSGQILQ
jgi:hypothetical protein